jgi:TolA-binding protein
MGTKSHSRHRVCGALASVCAVIIPTVVEAQDAAIARIDAIERQIHGLQTELQHLKGELGEAKQQLRQSRNEAQRAREEVHQAREAAERARQELKAATAESQTTETAPQVQAAVAAPPSVAVASAGVKVGLPEGRPTIALAAGLGSKWGRLDVRGPSCRLHPYQRDLHRTLGGRHSTHGVCFTKRPGPGLKSSRSVGRFGLCQRS